MKIPTIYKIAHLSLKLEDNALTPKMHLPQLTLRKYNETYNTIL